MADGYSADGALQLLRLRARSLIVSQETMERAQTLLQEDRWKDKDAADRLRKEWFNDMAFEDDEKFRRAAMDPDAHFIAWLTWRSREPYHVSFRAVDNVARKHGNQSALKMFNLRWPQEVAWAQRLRKSSDPKVAVVAALFLTEARRNPRKLFEALADLQRRNAASGLENERHPNYELSATAIRQGEGIESGWTPLFLQYGNRAFSEIVVKLPDVRMEQLAGAASREEDEDIKQQRLVRCLEYLKRYPLSCRVSALGLALRDGLTSNDLVACEQAFVDALSKGQIELPENEMMIDLAFYRWMEQADYKPDTPDDEEVRQRIANLSFINNTWVDDLPPDILELGATRRALFARWRAAVLTGRRQPPKSCVVDYALFVFEEAALE